MTDAVRAIARGQKGSSLMLFFGRPGVRRRSKSSAGAMRGSHGSDHPGQPADRNGAPRNITTTADAARLRAYVRLRARARALSVAATCAHVARGSLTT